jgi:6-phosphogluconolactonase (cycloisomerase 2 family)
MAMKNTKLGWLLTIVLLGCSAAVLAQGTNQPGFSYALGQDSLLHVGGVSAKTGQLRTLFSVLVPGSDPRALALAPSGQFLFVANYGSNDVAAFQVNSASGQLTWTGNFPAGGGPDAITVDPSSSFVYVANAITNDIVAFMIDQSTGTLLPMGGAPAGAHPVAIAEHPSGFFLYTVNQDSGDLSTFTIDPATGLPLPGPSVSAGTAPSSLVIHPSGQFLYVSNQGSNDVSQYYVDAASGMLVPLAANVAAGTGPASITLTPSASFAYVANSGSNKVSGYAVNSLTGTLTRLSKSAAAGTAPTRVRVDPSGKFAYVANSGSGDMFVFKVGVYGNLKKVGDDMGGSLSDFTIEPVNFLVTYTPRFAYVTNWNNQVLTYAIDPKTGKLSFIAAAAGDGSPSWVAVDVHARFAFVLDTTNNLISTYSINPNTGVLTKVESVYANTPTDLAVEPSGRFLYVVNSWDYTIDAYSIDQNTGALTLIGSIIGSGFGNTSQLTVDPSGHFLYRSPGAGGDGMVLGYAINPITGTLASLGAGVQTGNRNSGVTAGASAWGHFLYAADADDVNPSHVYGFRINPNTGALTSVGASVDADLGTSFLALDPWGRYLYAIDFTSSDVTQYKLTNNGVLTSLGNVATGFEPFQCTVEISGRFVYVIDLFDSHISVFKIVGGLLTLVQNLALPAYPAGVATWGTWY